MRLKAWLSSVKEKAKEKQVRLYDNLLGERIMKLPLEEQVRLARRLSIGPTHLIRATLLKQMPDNIRYYINQGKTGAEIKEMYWSCGEFTEWWGLLGLEEGMLDILIRDTILEG